MTLSADELRELAADCLEQARESGPRRAKQLRECARNFSRQALRTLLFEHSKEVGRSNVSLASFREHLRVARS